VLGTTPDDSLLGMQVMNALLVAVWDVAIEISLLPVLVEHLSEDLSQVYYGSLHIFLPSMPPGSSPLSMHLKNGLGLEKASASCFPIRSWSF